MSKPSPANERQCPACGGEFTVTSPPKKKKIQCPRCRAIVTLGKSTGTPELAEVAFDRSRAGRPDWKAQCESLQSRVEFLEAELKAVLDSKAPKPPDSSLPIPRDSASSPTNRQAVNQPAHPPGGHLSDLEVARDERAAGAESTATEFPRRALETLNFEEITLVTDRGDSETVQVAEFLAALLGDAGWKVHRSADRHDAAAVSAGLTFVAGPALPGARLSRTFGALSGAGFSVTLHLDPAIRANETRLVVGREVYVPMSGRKEFTAASETRFIAQVA